MSKRTWIAAAAAAGTVIVGAGAAEKAPARKAPVKAQAPVTSAADARRMIHMMDDIYMTGVLTANSMYVHDAGVPAAVTWAKQVIRRLKGKGWPDARIFAATDRPLHPENLPVDNFEREAINVFQKGSPSIERIEGSTIRYAREIRISDKSCLTCHVRNKEGDLVGGVSYRAPIRPGAPVTARRQERQEVTRGRAPAVRFR